MIRNVQKEDAACICGIYNHYVEHSTVTFEEEPVSVPAMEDRIRSISADFPWLVFEEEGRVIAYAYASRWALRSAWRFTVESSIYIRHDAVGKGTGTVLYEALLEKLAGMQVHTVIAGLALPNEPSCRLHEKLGFKKSGHIAEGGYKFGRWIDVGYWQLLV